jgi:hypothetical protein
MLTGDFVLSEIKKVAYYTLQKNNCLILCPFHKDRNPSCSVNLVEKRTPKGTLLPGVFKCWSCKESGSYNKLASKLGIATVKGNTNVVVPLAKKIELFSEKHEILSLEELKKPWRNIPLKLLKSLGVQLLWEEDLKDYYLYFPSHYLGSYIGHIRARIYDESPGLKYFFNLKEKLFYPYDYMLSHNTKTIVLVEGLSDMLRLVNYGIPCMATLGTYFNVEKGIEWLKELSVSNVIFCYDGDLAGYTSIMGKDNDGLWDIMSKDFKITAFFPPDNSDPFDMPIRYVRALKSLFLSYGGQLL